MSNPTKFRSFVTFSYLRGNYSWGLFWEFDLSYSQGNGYSLPQGSGLSYYRGKLRILLPSLWAVGFVS